MKFTNENDSLFTEEFLKKYMALGFANLPKKEIDIHVFTLMMKYGYLDGKDYYSIAKELMIDERKVKKMVLESSLRNEQDDTTVKSINSIRTKIFEPDKLKIKKEKIEPEIDETNKKITICIDNPVERRDFIYVIRCIGYSFDENLNPDRIQIPIYVFISVFCKYDDDIYKHFKSLTKEKMSNDSDREKAFKDSLSFIQRIQNGLAALNEPITTLASIASVLGFVMAHVH